MYTHKDFEKACDAAIKLAQVYCEKPYWKGIRIWRRIDNKGESTLALELQFFICDEAMEEEKNTPSSIDGFVVYMGEYSNEFAPGCGLTTMDGKVHYSNTDG
jgi:hypothetical protein